MKKRLEVGKSLLSGDGAFIIAIDENEVHYFGDVCNDHFHSEVNREENNLVEIYPIDRKGVERKWRYSRQSVEKVKALLKVKKINGVYDIQTVGKGSSSKKR